MVSDDLKDRKNRSQLRPKRGKGEAGQKEPLLHRETSPRKRNVHRRRGRERRRGLDRCEERQDVRGPVCPVGRRGDGVHGTDTQTTELEWRMCLETPTSLEIY